MARLDVYQFLLEPRLGGPHVRIHDVAKALPDSVRTHVVTCGKSEKASVYLLKLRGIWRPLYLLELMLNPVLIVLLFMLKRMRSRMLFHVNGPPNIAPILAAVVLRVPVVWHFNDSYGSMMSLVRLGKFLMKLTPSRMVTSAHAVAAAYGVTDYDVFYAPVNEKVWKRPEDAPFGPRDEDGSPVLLCVGNINPVKAHDVLLDALALLQAEGYSPLPKLRIVGARLDTHEEQYQKLATHDMREQLTLLGKQQGDVIRKELSACTLSLLPSRSEACPIALLEAMSMSCACIATKVGGVREMLSEQSGWLVPADDARAMADAIKQALAATPEELAEKGRAARETIEATFTVEAIAEVTRRVYSKLARVEL